MNSPAAAAVVGQAASSGLEPYPTRTCGVPSQEEPATTPGRGA